MAKLVPVQLDNGMILYIEGQEDTETEALRTTPLPGLEEEQGRTRKGLGDLPNSLKVTPTQSMEMVQNTIRTYTHYCLNAFKNVSTVNVDEVTLEFGVNISADAGIPYIASGKAQSNLKITVKCSYPKPEASESATNGQTSNGQLPIAQ
ncbi:CU044_2847 family protein [Pantanalinema rosaneae CENA516]|uniref:CU044_2847 family protein n=1 Tax=Pantanalinema rosaneae TaxID=1620701 RepID=UPI003D6E7BE3